MTVALVRPRILGLRVRALRKTNEEASPSQLAVKHDTGVELMELNTEQDEVDFIRGKLPMCFRKPMPSDKLTDFLPHHVTWKAAEGQVPDDLLHLTRQAKAKKAKKDEEAAPAATEIVTNVPEAYEGLKPGDVVVMALGTGDLIARDIAEFGGEMGVRVFRIPGKTLKDAREARGRDKDGDAELLTTLYTESPHLFYLVRKEDFIGIHLELEYGARMEAQTQRIRMSNRLLGEARNTLLKSQRSEKPIDSLEAAYEATKQNDANFQRFEREEKDAEKRIGVLLERTEIWGILKDVKGIGPITAAGIIAGVGVFRRFMADETPEETAGIAAARKEITVHLASAEYESVKSRLAEVPKNGFDRMRAVREYWLAQGNAEKAESMQLAMKGLQAVRKLEREAFNRGQNRFLVYCGVHVNEDGTFPRRMKGGKNNWSPGLRQRLYLMADIMNKNSTAHWGLRLREIKAKLQATHPEVVEREVEIKGKKVMRKFYTKGHIHRMALWRLATRFTQWLYRKWYELEKHKTGNEPAAIEQNAAK
jgi:hypothetical protein